jgi:hypothetical protein
VVRGCGVAGLSPLCPLLLPVGGCGGAGGVGAHVRDENLHLGHTSHKSGVLGGHIEKKSAAYVAFRTRSATPQDTKMLGKALEHLLISSGLPAVYSVRSATQDFPRIFANS